MWILQSSGPKAGSFTFRVRPGTISTVGRARRADFILEAPLVSRLHCRLEASHGDLEVIDLDSTNGTYVNDKRIERTRLKHGDRLRVGRVELTVEKDLGENADGTTRKTGT